MKQNRRKPHRQSRHNSRLRLERLEQRVPLAADIGVESYVPPWVMNEVSLDNYGYSSVSALNSTSPTYVNFAKSLETQRPAEVNDLSNHLATELRSNVLFVDGALSAETRIAPTGQSTHASASIATMIVDVDAVLSTGTRIASRLPQSTTASTGVAVVFVQDSVEIASIGKSFTQPVASSVVSTDVLSAQTQSAAAQAILTPPARASDAAFSEPARLLPQVEKFRADEPGFIDGHPARLGAIAMTNGMGTLGLDVVHERLETRQPQFMPEQLPHSLRALESDYQQGSESISDWKSISDQARRELSITNIAIPGSGIEPLQLFVGGPIERLHGFEAFDIFRDLVVEAPVMLEATQRATQQVPELSLSRAIWVAGVTIGFGSFGASLYVLNHQEFTRRIRSEKTRAQAILLPMWGHATFLAIDVLLDETKPMIVKLRM